MTVLRRFVREADDRVVAIVAGIIAFAFVDAVSHLTPTDINNYSRLADAWLHGRSWIVYPGAWIDAVPYHGRAYVVEAPFPALLMLPLAAIYGAHANQNLVAALLAAVAVGALYVFARRVGDRPGDALVLCVFLLFGTDVAYGAFEGNVWLLAHLSAVAFTLLALAELTGAQRLWLVTLFGLAAALSRYPMALALPVYWWLLRDRLRSPRSLEIACAVVLPILALWSAYNWSRWGVLYDPGFTIWYHVMDPRSHHVASPLGLVNVPSQMHLFFFESPNVLNAWPWVAPRRFGTALTFASAGLLVAFAAPPRHRLVVPLALLALVLAIPVLLYYDGGGVQFGVRHALDFEPFLLCLIALALREPPLLWKRVVLIASAAFGAYLFYVWRAFPAVVN
jgi:hypothetical protein